MIGNDIIDLKLAKKESNYRRAGFLEKQFSGIYFMIYSREME